MPLIHQQVINQNTSVGVWHITEPLSVFTQSIQLQRIISHPHKQLQHAAGRYLLQYLQPNFPVNSIQIAANNKPYIENNNWYFSISHCGNYAAAIISKQPVGIDVEIPKPTVLKVVHKFLNNQERIFFKVEQITANTALVLPTVLWSIKEAVFKWWGKGEVDFKNCIQIQPFSLQQQGQVQVLFKHNLYTAHLQLQYIVFDIVVLVYVVDGE